MAFVLFVAFATFLRNFSFITGSRVSPCFSRAAARVTSSVSLICSMAAWTMAESDALAFAPAMAPEITSGDRCHFSIAAAACFGSILPRLAISAKIDPGA